MEPNRFSLGAVGPEDNGAFVLTAKRSLRQKLRALRSALPMVRATERSLIICDRVLQLPVVRSAQSVGLFWPIVERREVDLRPLDANLRSRGVRICYPFMEPCEDGNTETGFRFVTELSQLVSEGRRFAEPTRDAQRVVRGEVDVIVVPALAVTLDGHRLGYGSGFYDATLPDLCPPAKSIVVAYDFQRMMELPIEPHDKRCDFVVTDA